MGQRCRETNVDEGLTLNTSALEYLFSAVATPPPPPPTCSMLDSPRRRMRRDSQLKLNINTGGGEGSEDTVKLNVLPKSFDDDCSFVNCS